MHRAAHIFFAMVLITGIAEAQSAEEKARIDYEAAKLALQQNKPSVALTKLQGVLEVLGPLPELLYTAAEAAFQTGDVARAQGFAGRAYDAADSAFKASEVYPKLIALSARIEVEGPGLIATASGYWIDDTHGLLWVLQDSGGRRFNWDDANLYCRELSVGGRSGWRLPTIVELRGIYDPSRDLGDLCPYPESRVDKVPWHIRIRAPLAASCVYEWSSTTNGPSSPFVFSFNDGTSFSSDPRFWARALCVQTSGG